MVSPLSYPVKCLLIQVQLFGPDLGTIYLWPSIMTYCRHLCRMTCLSVGTQPWESISTCLCGRPVSQNIRVNGHAAILEESSRLLRWPSSCHQLWVLPSSLLRTWVLSMPVAWHGLWHAALIMLILPCSSSGSKLQEVMLPMTSHPWTRSLLEASCLHQTQNSFWLLCILAASSHASQNIPPSVGGLTLSQCSIHFLSPKFKWVS